MLAISQGHATSKVGRVAANPSAFEDQEAHCVTITVTSMPSMIEVQLNPV